MSITDRFKKSWNAFMGRDPTSLYTPYYYGSSSRPDRPRFSCMNARSIITTIYNRIAVDAAQMNVRHVRLDEDDHFKEIIDSDLNYALSVSANLDQSGRAFIQDAIMSLFDEGCVALVPTDTDVDPIRTDSYKIYELRVGKITQWFPDRVRIDVYREDTGQREEVTLPKRMVAIVENPFYSIMNEPNSTAKRLVRTLNQLDDCNEEISANKLDLIIQFPYLIKSPAKKIQAEARRKELVDQLSGAKYGVAYTDGTEKIVQLNRSLENNLWTQAKELQTDLFNQLGMTQKIMDGTADETETLNYYNRTIEPILTALTEAMDRVWITKTARTQKQAIRFYRDSFKLVPINNIAEIADKFTRNEILSSNEIRSIIGFKPSKDPKADELINSNLNHPEESEPSSNEEENLENIQNEERSD